MPLSGSRPELQHAPAEAGEQPRFVRLDFAAASHVVERGGEHAAVGVELQLLGGTVADADGLRAGVAFPVRQFALGHVGSTMHVVQDLQLWPGEPGRVQKPSEECARFLHEAEPSERAHRQRGVAQPAISIVPVAVAAQRFG